MTTPEADGGTPDEETRTRDAIVCPWCYYRHRDVTEMVDHTKEDDVREGQCHECEKPIRYHVKTSHVYVCEPILGRSAP